jgi:ABC-type oligopeptide transport system substrate-binding subunit
MKQFTIALAAFALAACASTSSSPDTTSAQKPMEEKEYRIGSRIPVRDPSATSSSPTMTVEPGTGTLPKM